MTSWIIAISSIITATTVVVLWRQSKSDHERSRREKAVELLLEWTKNLNEKSSLARKFAETLDQKQSISLFKQESFETEKSNKRILEGYLAKDIQENGNISLSVEDVSKIRWDVISYLNLLEAVLMAWRHNIADKEMILEEFKYLVKPSEGHDVLKEFRKAAGDTFPAIDEFVKTLEENNKESTGKAKIA